MALPQYNSLDILNTGDGANNAGRWKGFMQSNPKGATATISITPFGQSGGAGITLEHVKADTVYPISFRATYAKGCTASTAKGQNPITFYGLN